MGCCVSDEEKESNKSFDKMDADNSSSVSRAEFAAFINDPKERLVDNIVVTAQLNLGLEEARCRELVVDVAMRLATQSVGQMTKSQFHRFREKFISSPKGHQEFLHRCVFEAYDKDGNGVLDAAELDAYLSVYFDGTFVRNDDPRLQKIDKDKLQRHVLDKMDADKNGLLSFEEIHALISGELDLNAVVDATE